ncbi:MAG: hypothetical protein HC897_04795 [Thermoanaerobaculia bacterium]|nr:hypothetical protein [Thermoanaerobaculia bacterium]
MVGDVARHPASTPANWPLRATAGSLFDLCEDVLGPEPEHLVIKTAEVGTRFFPSFDPALVAMAYAMGFVDPPVQRVQRGLGAHPSPGHERWHLRPPLWAWQTSVIKTRTSTW